LPPNFVPITPLTASIVVDGIHAPSARFGIRPNLPNRSPVVQALPDVTKKVGDSVRIQVVATDPDDALLVYSATGLPAGLSIDGATGLITGQLPQGSAGSYAVTVTATDTVGASGDATFNLTVEEADDGWGLYFPQIHNGVESSNGLYLPEIHNGIEDNMHLYFAQMYR
ncbi:MAG: Ig domain-containing protein, partial [Caldilineaceae bacterium]